MLVAVAIRNDQIDRFQGSRGLEWRSLMQQSRSGWCQLSSLFLYGWRVGEGFAANYAADVA